MPQAHRFPLRLSWTGAAAGPASDVRGFDRRLRLEIPGKAAIEASSAPAFRGDAGLHNPEELLLAAVASCHCLSYLYVCARSACPVAAYSDEAEAVLGWVGDTFAITEAILRPRVALVPGADPALARSLHAEAHRQCFIARSVSFPIRIEDVVESS